jgi:hypothetical protein
MLHLKLSLLMQLRLAVSQWAPTLLRTELLQWEQRKEETCAVSVFAKKQKTTESLGALLVRYSRVIMLLSLKTQ